MGSTFLGVTLDNLKSKGVNLDVLSERKKELLSLGINPEVRLLTETVRRICVRNEIQSHNYLQQILEWYKSEAGRPDDIWGLFYMVESYYGDCDYHTAADYIFAGKYNPKDMSLILNDKEERLRFKRLFKIDKDPDETDEVSVPEKPSYFIRGKDKLFELGEKFRTDPSTIDWKTLLANNDIFFGKGVKHLVAIMTFAAMGYIGDASVIMLFGQPNDKSLPVFCKYAGLPMNSSYEDVTSWIEESR